MVDAGPNDKVERRAVAVPSIEVDLYASSTCLHGPPKLPAARSPQPFVRCRVSVGIAIKKSPDHPLILGAMEASLFFEEIDASFRKCDGDLLRILTKYQLAGWGEKIFNNIQTPKRLICVLDWLFHTSVNLASSTLHRKYE